MESRKHIISGMRIAQALASDYISIYYVNIQNDRFIEYRSTDEYHNLGIEAEGEDFFSVSAKNARRVIHPDDQETFIQALTKENLLARLKDDRTFMLTYRMMFDGEPKYVQLKATPMGDEDREHIVIGVLDIDEHVRLQRTLEQARKDRVAYSRIFALSGDFICIYTVDPGTGRYTVYSQAEDYGDLGLTRDGEDFFANAARDSVRAVYREDRELFNAMFTREKVLRTIREEGMFALNYRMLLGGRPTWVCLKAALVTEQGREVLIVGTNNINAQVQREREYAHDLFVARTQAHRDALTGVKNRSAYLDVEQQLNRRIESGEPVRFAVVVCDLNDLKQTNDTLGHQAGDQLLKDACSVICRVFQHSPVFRVGGDEFAVISQGSDYEHIGELMNLMRRSNESGGAVIACGMARFEGDASVSEVFRRADDRMYEDKKTLKHE